MLYKVANETTAVYETLIHIRTLLGNYAYISYVDGEFGLRVWIYNSYVKSFTDKVKKLNIPIVGVCFIGQTCFMEHLCDHVIEIQNTQFTSIAPNQNIDNSHTSVNHRTNNFVPKNEYTGTDGWDLTYIRGVHYEEYEEMLEKLQFDNIFYTLHCDGARLINKYNHQFRNAGNFIMYKCAGSLVHESAADNDMLMMYKQNTIPALPSQPVKLNNKIAIWIRNTNKWPDRNMPPTVYLYLFDYCIKHKITLYVFQDLTPVKLPSSEYIVECNDRINNIPDFDKFKKICDDCCVYIGVSSGPLYIVNTLCNIYTICINGDPYHYFNENAYNITASQDSIVKLMQSIFGI
jgi:hypothetical protein